MRNFVALTRRELLSVFVSPLGYGTAAVFLFIFGLIFVSQFAATKLVEVRTLIDPMGYLLPLLLSPILTMRLMAEERRQGTLEMLLTAPVRNIEVVLSKFAGAWLFYTAMLALTLIHLFAMRFHYEGEVDWGRFAVGYLGMLLIAGLFLSFGLFVSSLFEQPMLAALTSFVASLTLLMVNFVLNVPAFLQEGVGKDVFRFTLPFTHYRNFLAGLVDTGDLAYFVLLTAYFLFLTAKVLEARRSQ